MITKRRRAIFDEVNTERNRQDRKWGGKQHDSQHGVDDWVGYIYEHAQRALDRDEQVTRKQLVRVAALAVAALENLP